MKVLIAVSIATLLTGCTSSESKSSRVNISTPPGEDSGSPANISTFKDGDSTSYVPAVEMGNGSSVPVVEAGNGSEAKFWSLPAQASSEKIVSRDITRAMWLGNILYAWTPVGLSFSTDSTTWTTRAEPIGIEDALAFSKIKPIRALTTTAILELDESNATWKKISTFDDLNIPNNSQFYFDNYDIYIAANSEVKIYRDSIKKWVSRGSVHGLVGTEYELVYAEAKKVYVQGPSGISFSEDGGDTFTLWKTNVPLSIPFDGKVLGLGRATATKEGVRFTGSTTYLRTTMNGLPSNNVLSVFQTNGTTFAATDKGLARGKGAAEIWEVLIPNLEIRNVRVSETGVIVVASSNGVGTSIDGGKNFVFSTNNNSFEGVQVDCLEISDGRLIASGRTDVTSTSRGISAVFVSDNNAESFSDPIRLHGGSKDKLDRHCVRGKSKVHFSVSSFGVFRTVDLEDWALIPFPPLSGGIPPAIVVDEDQAILLAGGSLYLIDSVAKEWKPLGKINVGSTTSPPALIGINKKSIIISTYEGLYYSTSNYQTFAKVEKSNGLTDGDFSKPDSYSQRVTNVFFDDNSAYAIAGEYLNISTDGMKKWKSYRIGKNLKKIIASGSSIFISSPQGVYISTNGLASVSLKTTNNGLASNDVLDLAFENGALYCGTSKGLSVLNPLVPVGR